MGSLTVTNLSPVGLGRGWADRATNNLQFTDDVVYSRGAHDAKPIIVTPAEHDDLIAFLQALTSDDLANALRPPPQP